ncbi:nucleoside deaminase [Alkalicoccus luteus]|uniref:Nucleoside deaminase n=1 Tax=Alkalicoccus luteus TaxID=1237094 RepID=A0A969PNA0_9BACI|nr:nucleoside deaminase [Alkalicoccus luteus]NJP37347.1 nucleoside deaminase [Alkalicoccus luteus]
MTHDAWMQKCVEMAVQNVEDGMPPFAAVVVKDGEEIASAVNDGPAEQDPTAHGEIRALQKAGKELGSTDLSGCVLYTNCEPCPMCLGAVYWSGIKDVYYGLSIEGQAEFDDLPKQMYEEYQKEKGKRSVRVRGIIPHEVDPRAPFVKQEEKA